MKTINSVSKKWFFSFRFFLLIIVACISLILTSCKVFDMLCHPKDYEKIDKQHTDNLIRDPIDSNVYKILLSKIKSIKTDPIYEIPNNGYFKVSLTPEVAPYIIGQVVKKNQGIAQTTLPTLLNNLNDINTEMKFIKPEICMFVDKKVKGSISSTVGNIQMSDTDKLYVIYQRVYSGINKSGKWNTSEIEKAIKKYHLSEIDSLYVVVGAEVKLFTCSIYSGFRGSVSAAITSIVNIDGSLYQGSGKDVNIYELYLQLAPLYFPKVNLRDSSNIKFLGQNESSTIVVGKTIDAIGDISLKLNKTIEYEKLEMDK